MKLFIKKFPAIPNERFETWWVYGSQKDGMGRAIIGSFKYLEARRHFRTLLARSDDEILEQMNMQRVGGIYHGALVVKE